MTEFRASASTLQLQALLESIISRKLSLIPKTSSALTSCPEDTLSLMIIIHNIIFDCLQAPFLARQKPL